MMDEIKSLLNRVTNLMEQDNRGVQIGCYSVALIGLTFAIRRVRPFSRFKKPSDVPNHFINERRELTGVVERIDPNGGLLMVKHKPLVPLPLLSGGELPVKISGVEVTGLGVSWLQAIVTGSQIKFVPISKDPNFLQCEVLMPQITHDKKERIINVGESLIKIGFGQVVDVDSAISSDKTYLAAYQSRLVGAEKYALKKKLGIRYYVKPTKSALTTVFKSFNYLIQSTSKKAVKVPKLVTS